VYQDIVVVEVKVIEIDITIVQGSTVYSTGTTKTDQPTYTPPPPSPPPSSTTTGAPASKQTHKVELRADNGVVHYVPDRVNADVGDFIEFIFLKANHSATQSTFDKPCTKLDGGFDSQLIPNLNGTVSAEFERLFEVKDKAPKWFYCKQPVKNHCGQGMVFGINPKSDDQMNQFIENAKKQNGDKVNPPSTTGSAAATSAASTTVASSTASSTATGAAAPLATVVVSGGLTPEGVNTLKFDPPFIPIVPRGSSVVFDFRKLNHTLTESTLENPCKKKPGTDVDTNFMNFNMADKPLQNATTITFDSEGPRYFYCKQANGKANGHCKNGMVFAINVDQNGFNTFQTNAKNTAVTIPGKRSMAWDA
jgi:plastocyanin